MSLSTILFLPEPDLPTIPIFSLALTVKPIPFRAKGRLSLYFILYFSNFISPDFGHSAGGLLSFIIAGASLSTSCEIYLNDINIWSQEPIC